MIFVRLLATVALFFVAVQAAAIEKDEDGQLVTRVSMADKVHQYKNPNVQETNGKKPDHSKKPVACTCVKIEDDTRTVWLAAMLGQKVHAFTTSDCSVKSPNDVFPNPPVGKAFSRTQQVPSRGAVTLGSVWFQLNGACQIKSFFQHIPWSEIVDIGLKLLEEVGSHLFK